MSWTEVKALKEKRAKLFAEATELRSLGSKENRDLTADEAETHDKMLADVEKIGGDIARVERALEIGSTIGVIGRDDSDKQSNSFGIAEKDFSKYSLLRALQRRMNNQPLDGIEAELSAEIAKRTGKDPQGFYFPTEIAFGQRALTTTTGAGAVATITAPTFIEMLRAESIVAGLGARMLPNMVGNFSLPKQTGGATAYWVTEGNAPSISNATIGQVGFAPKTVGAYSDISRKFINQSGIDAEQFVRQDLAETLATEIDRVALAGSGVGAEPRGIINNTAVPDLTTGGALDHTNIVDFETELAVAKALRGNPHYVTTPRVKGYLKTTPKGGNNPTGYLWGDDNRVNGYSAIATTHLTDDHGGSGNSAMIFGNFADLIIAMWGGLDIIVDPYTGSNSGTVRIVALQDVDMQLRHAASFVRATDISHEGNGS